MVKFTIKFFTLLILCPVYALAHDHSVHSHTDQGIKHSAPEAALQFTLSGFHFSPTKDACLKAISFFNSEKEGVAELLALRENTHIPVVHMQAHSCLLHFLKLEEVQQAMLNDPGVSNRPGFVRATVFTIANGRTEIPDSFTEAYIDQISISPLATDRKIGFLEHIVASSVSDDLKSKATAGLNRLSLNPRSIGSD